MKFSDDLFMLIQTLTQSEKRYFKLFAKAFSSKGTKNQLDLFDAFDQQQKFDEEKIRKAFEDRISPKNFHVAKNRLYHLILRALHLFHLQQSPKEKINQMLYQAEILRKKGLHQQSESLLLKAKKQAEEGEHFLLAVQAVRQLAIGYQVQRDVQKLERYLEGGLEEEFHFLEQSKRNITYGFLELKTLFFTHKKQSARTEEDMDVIHSIKMHPLLRDESMATTKRGQTTFIFLNGFICRYEGDYEQACSYWGRFVERFEQKKQLTRNNMFEYIADLNNLMFLQLEGLYIEQSNETCRKLENLLGHQQVHNDAHLTLRIQERVTEFRLAFFMVSYRYTKGLIYIEEQLNFIQTALLPKVDAFRQLAISYHLACLYICNDLPDKALEWLDVVFRNKRLKEHEYLYSGAMIVNLLVHFDLGNFQLLESLVLNTYRMMYKRNLLYKSERIIFKYLRQYLKVHHTREVVDSFDALKKELLEAQCDRLEQSFLDKMDLVIWIESKIQRKKMNEVVSLNV